MDLKKTMNTDYLGSWDFKTGETKVLTIKEVVEKKIYNPNKNKDEMTTIMYFTNHPCGLILNTTNKKTLIKVFQTSITEQYHGKNVGLITKLIKVRGEDIEAVRIADKLPIQPAAATPKTKELFAPEHKGWDAAVEALKQKTVTIDQIKSKYELTEETIQILKSHETI
jgi:hypothetical protein